MVEVVRQLIQCDIPKNLKVEPYDEWIEAETEMVNGNIPKNLNVEMYHEWIKTEKEVVKDKIQKLKLPTMFQESLTSMVNPIFRHMWRANKYFCKQTPTTPINTIQKCIRMCPWGTVDMKRSAEALLGLSPEELPKLVRYRFSLVFCLVDHVANTYEDLDEKDKLLLPKGLNYRIGSSTQSIGANGFMLRGEQRSDFVCAVLDANEVAARHFWKEAETLPSIAELRSVSHFSGLGSFPDVSGLYLFLLSRYPTDIPLQTSLLKTGPFLASLIEWPYLDVFLHLFPQTNENHRFHHLNQVIDAIFTKSLFNLYNGDILENFHQFLKTFLLANADRHTEWFLVAFKSIKSALRFNNDKNEVCTCVVQSILEFLDERDKVRICEGIQVDVPIIVNIILTRNLPRLEWLFQVCVTNQQAKIIKRKMLMDRVLRRLLFQIVGPFQPIDEIIYKFVNFCCTSQNVLGERTLEVERYLHDFEVNRELVNG